MRILIAEDDLTSRVILSGILGRFGYDPIVVNDGDEAWRILQEDDAPRLVILDWSMPGLDGPEVCRRVRTVGASDPHYIILLTAKDDKRSIVEGLEAGANDYIAKPYDTNELRARIRVGQRMLELQADLNETKNDLAHRAMHDPLTGVLNRGAIIDRLHREMFRAKRSGTPLSVGMCDIDLFKQINDRHGHQAGDDALCEFTRRLQGNLRSYDLVGRYGGEEFLVVAPDSRGVPEEGLYERLRTRMAEKEITTRSGPVALTTSIGVAALRDGISLDDLLALADNALYRAKADGRNRVAYEIPSN